MSRDRLHHHARIVAVAKLQQLAARIAMGHAREDESNAHAQLSVADNERQRTLHFWQERLSAPAIDPILVTQITRLLVQNEATYEEAQGASDAAAARIHERRTDLGQAEGRYAALKRALARTRHKQQRKHEEAATDDRPRISRGGLQS